MISAIDIEAFKEDNMGVHKDILAKAGDQLGDASYSARRKPLGLEALIQPALDFMAKLPVDSYLIGGSLRDVVNGRPIRDFDVYVGPEFHVGMIPVALRDRSHVTEGTEYAGQVGWGTCNFDHKLRSVIEIDTQVDDESNVINYGPNVQIMVLKEMFATPEAAARSVDFGICQIVYNLKTGLYATPEFFRDCICETFTFLGENRSDNDKLRSVDRFKRLHADKYYGYRLIGLKA